MPDTPTRNGRNNNKIKSLSLSLSISLICSKCFLLFFTTSSIVIEKHEKIKFNDLRQNESGNRNGNLKENDCYKNKNVRQVIFLIKIKKNCKFCIFF